jgi:hypothetical protein
MQDTSFGPKVWLTPGSISVAIDRLENWEKAGKMKS